YLSIKEFFNLGLQKEIVDIKQVGLAILLLAYIILSGEGLDNDAASSIGKGFFYVTRHILICISIYKKIKRKAIKKGSEGRNTIISTTHNEKNL
ncbi:hypothetical protein, partial [Bacillus haikouensis]|uniref:hypothetical protein n=1 Tax=Bacillus haikouensis TaxID=1510468 RepID=UPI001C12F54E